MTTSILIVDDASMVRLQLRAKLQQHGYEVLEAGDGAEALAKLDESPQTSLILCDVHMPYMNGVELLERLHARASTIPVVMLTAEADTEVIRRAKGLGAKAWLIKPFKFETLLGTVTRILAARDEEAR
jgi:CheY-like chemotaxis protein